MAKQFEDQKIVIEQLLNETKLGPLRLFKWQKAIQSQQKTLRLLIEEARNTVFGLEHHFDEILKADGILSAFKKVPISSYSGMKPYWERAYHGEKNVAWPGETSYFALSSGTTDAASKYIPVSKKMLRKIKKASIRQLFHIARTDFPKDYLAKDYLFVGGSTDLEFNGNNFSGDLSGITTGNIPVWMRRFSKPEPDVRSQKEWEHKINLMVERAPHWDVAMIAGVPAWIQLLFERIIKTYELNTIHDLWPNLSVYIHGGVSLRPYKKGFGKYLAKPIKYFETYLASEGFIAFQTKENERGMRLIFRNGIYFEFVPFNSKNFDANGEIRPTAEALGVQEVQTGVDYGLLITTCSGAWRYLIGDTIRFVDTQNFMIEITGRTKHFLSLCGEHLSVDNMNDAITLLSEELGVEITEFTVKGLSEQGKFAHHWYIGSDTAIDENRACLLLDELLKTVNDDYRVERKFALAEIKLTVLPQSTFLGWMESRGKVGSQNKFPRVMNDQLYANWVGFVESVKQEVKETV